MESIGLYHQTGSGTSRFLLEKSISRPDWSEPAARLGPLDSLRGKSAEMRDRDAARTLPGLHKMIKIFVR
jgi:hypothetical protein